MSLGRRGLEVLLLSLPVLWFLRGMLDHMSWVGSFGDIRSFHFWWQVERTTLLEYGELPFWNPYYCGGMVHWANVQTMFGSPTSLLGLAFGAGVGMRLHMILYFIAGFAGCFYLAKHRGLSGPWAIAPGVAFVFGANFAERATGHVSFMPFLLTPLVLLCFERGLEDRRFVGGLGLLLGSAVWAGAPYPFVMLCLYVGLLAVVHAAGRVSAPATRTWRALMTPFAVAFAGIGLGTAIAAMKLVPVIAFMRMHPRLVPESDYLLPWQLWETFLRAPLVRERKGYTYVFGEYRQYLGPIVMASLPLMLMSVRRLWRDYAMLLVLGSLMLGAFATWAPFSLLQELPVFASLRVPVRYALLLDVHLALLFGELLAALPRIGAELPWRPAAKIGFAGAALGLALVTADLGTNNNRQLFGFFNTPDEAPPRLGPFHQTAGSPHLVFQAPLRNEGQVRCYEANPIRISRELELEATSEVRLRQGSGTATLRHWTPNTMDIDIGDLGGPGGGPGAVADSERLVVVNTNYYPDWHAEPGVIEEVGGRLGVRLPPTVTATHLYFRPAGLGPLGLVSALGLAGCVALLRRWNPGFLRRFFRVPGTGR